MSQKFFLLIIFNIILLIAYEAILHSTNIKDNYDKWKQFYETYKSAPFSYIDNLLPFTPDEMFFEISNFVQKLSFFISNSGYSLDDLEEYEYHPDIIVNHESYINNNTKYINIETDIIYDDYLNLAINEITLLEEAVINENSINIKTVLKNGLNKNKIIILFIFFIQQLQIFQNLERNIDLNKIYYLQKNKTNIEELEIYYENIFNYENNLELLSLTKQFVEYHKDFGFFNLNELKKENFQKITKSEKNMIDLFIKLKYINKEDYKNINDLSLGYFLNLFERTTKSINYLGMANSLYKKASPQYDKDIITLRIIFGVLFIFINLITLANCPDDEKKRKKYKKF